MTERTRIVLCDDHPIVLEGLRNLIAAEDGFEIVGEALTGTGGLSIVREARPDMAIVDIAMPDLNGIQLVRRLACEMPSIRVLVFTLHEERGYLKQALDAGARGYVLKRSATANLGPALRAVVAGGIYIDPGIAQRILGNGPARNHRAAFTAASLTDREADVLKLTSFGLTNKEIARRLEVGVKSIETYKARGLAKLDIKTRADLLRYASTIGWLSEI
jgi:DNA-binding NarL/FixJ family response regulator